MISLHRRRVFGGSSADHGWFVGHDHASGREPSTPPTRRLPSTSSCESSPARGGPIDKTASRAWARRLPAARPDDSRAIVATLATLDDLSRARVACLFLAMPGEVDLAGLPARLPGVRWVTTRTGSGPLLTVHDLAAPRERHPYGFEQPIATAPRIGPERVDVWLVPGLAFDPLGIRLGHGRGYYDRLLARRSPGARLVGVTTSPRIATALPHEPHDVDMDLVVTEASVLAPTARPDQATPRPSQTAVSRPGPGSRGTTR